VDFHGERRLNQTHASTTDPEARLFRKGKGNLLLGKSGLFHREKPPGQIGLSQQNSRTLNGPVFGGQVRASQGDAPFSFLIRLQIRSISPSKGNGKVKSFMTGR
jgi:hypothetical protein